MQLQIYTRFIFLNTWLAKYASHNRRLITSRIKFQVSSRIKFLTKQTLHKLKRLISPFVNCRLVIPYSHNRWLFTALWKFNTAWHWIKNNNIWEPNKSLKKLSVESHAAFTLLQPGTNNRTSSTTGVWQHEQKKI